MSSSLEMNKIAAAILVGGMLTLGIGIVSNAIYHPGHGEQAGGEGGAAEAPAAPAAIEPISKLLASADPAKGEAVAKKCQTCHDFTKGGPNEVGPNLWGVIGREAGRDEELTDIVHVRGACMERRGARQPVRSRFGDRATKRRARQRPAVAEHRRHHLGCSFA